MTDPITVYRNRTNILPVSLGIDVSNDVITSQIRESPNSESDLIATWIVSMETDGIDGEIVLKLDNSITAAITKSKGYMDLKRVVDNEPLNIFNSPLEVLFKDVVTP